MSSEFKIKVNDGQSVTAILYPAAKGKRTAVTVVLGHGAGADQNSGFMRMAAADLAARGFDVVTFNFLYKEHFITDTMVVLLISTQERSTLFGHRIEIQRLVSQKESGIKFFMSFTNRI